MACSIACAPPCSTGCARLAKYASSIGSLVNAIDVRVRSVRSAGLDSRPSSVAAVAPDGDGGETVARVDEIPALPPSNKTISAASGAAIATPAAALRNVCRIGNDNDNDHDHDHGLADAVAAAAAAAAAAATAARDGGGGGGITMGRDIADRVSPGELGSIMTTPEPE